MRISPLMQKQKYKENPCPFCGESMIGDPAMWMHCPSCGYYVDVDFHGNVTQHFPITIPRRVKVAKSRERRKYLLHRK